MPIQLGDIKLVASAVMDDVPEGGGAPSSHVIEDNKRNEIFKDISESDRARGRLNMSKTFIAVQTQDTDTYLGANAVVAKPPEDPNVSITMFSTGEVYDTRQQAQARLEAYLNKGAEWAGFLYENHIAGQRTVQLFQRPSAEVPTVGKTLALVANEGLSNQREQYVRATRVTTELRTFTYDNDKDFQAAVVTLELSDALRYDMPGTSANRSFQRSPTSAHVRDTLVADAANYAGVVPLAAPAAVGDFSIRAKDIYTPLVPSAQVETPIVNNVPYSQAGTPVRSGTPVTYSTTQPWTTTNNLQLPGGCLPGSLTIVVSGVTIKDKAGVLVIGEQQVGTVDYTNGTLVSTTGAYGAANKIITYEPAAYVQRLPQSTDIAVTAESRSQNYVGFISPVAARGTVSISYQVQGTWYVLSDAGDGSLRGYDASFGAGNYNHDTGAYVVTLGALPDVGSSVVIQWGVPTQEYAHPSAPVGLSQTISLPDEADEAVDPAYFKATWLVDGVTKTATAAADGTLSGDATGRVDVGLKEVRFQPNTLPLFGTEINLEYSTGVRSETNLPHPARDGQGKLPVSAGVGGLLPGSVSVEWNTFTDMNIFGLYSREQLNAMGVNAVDPIHTARDDTAGNLVLNGAVIGTVNYTTGAILFNPDVTVSVPDVQYASQLVSGNAGQGTQLWRLNYTGLVYRPAASTYPNDESGYVNIKFHTTSGSNRKIITSEFTPDFQLAPGVSAPVVPGSVLLQVAGAQPWGDSGTGVLRERTDAGWLQRGTINYVDGRVTLTSWPAGVSSQATRVSTATSLGENVSSAYVFRTAAAPLRPGSLTIQFADASGGVQTVTASLDGSITAAGVVGTVDYQTGLVRLGFGTMVAAAGNETEPWYDASRVDAGQIFKPAPVAGSTVRYSAVAFSYMPLNADLIGIDPVRLPSDGRVPIFRSGTMVVVGHTKVTGPMTPSNGQTINLARTRLSRAVVRDNTGAAVYSGYSVDLEAGTLTFSDVSGMATPVTIEDRIEDMAVARDVQISGQITFTRQITHDYPVPGSYVSSALEFGDRKARVNVTFDQATWNGVEWADSPTSAVAAGTYNTTLAPIVVTNAGASTERWGLWFTSTTQFRVIGEHVGQIATGDINTDCAPINPATGEPYFEIKAIGWGTGWANGNVLRVNTIGALAPVWIVRTVQPGPEAGVDYSFDLLTRGDVDRP